MIPQHTENLRLVALRSYEEDGSSQRVRVAFANNKRPFYKCYADGTIELAKMKLTSFARALFSLLCVWMENENIVAVPSERKKAILDLLDIKEETYKARMKELRKNGLIISMGTKRFYMVNPKYAGKYNDKTKNEAGELHKKFLELTKQEIRSYYNV